MKKTMLWVMLAAILLSACAQATTTIAPTETTQATAVEGSVEVTPAAAVNQLPYFESADCPFILPPGQVEGETVNCGYLVVSENRSDPNTRSIRLATAVFHPDDGITHPDPIVYLAGGPGGSALELLHQSFEVFSLVANALGRDLVIFDQRGIGLSEPALDCPEVIETGLDLLDYEIDGETITSEEAYDLVLNEYIACGETLNVIADLTAYNSAANAADVNDLLHVLGYEQWNLWGGSYGTRLAQTVMRDYPEGIRSVVLDAVYPLEADLYLEAPSVLSHALKQLFDRCAADTDCDAAYPNLKQTFFETVKQLNIEPAAYQIVDPTTSKTYDVQMNGDGLIGTIFQYLYLTEVIPMLPQMIADASAGDYTLLAGIRSQLLTRKDLISHGMQFSVQCNEEIPFGSMESFEEILVGYPELTSFYKSTMVGALSYDVCQDWPSGRADPIENQAVHSDIPTLVMTGEFDPIALPAWSKQVADNLENAYFFEFPSFGHGSTSYECPRNMLISFINAPAQEPDSSCIADIELTFVIPAQLAGLDLALTSIESSGVEALMPVGWLEVYDYYHVSPDRKIELVVKKETGSTPEDFLARWGSTEPVNEIQNEELTWQVYPLRVEDTLEIAAGYVAISALEDGFYMVLGIGPEAQQDAIGEHLVTPIVMSFTVSGD